MLKATRSQLPESRLISSLGQIPLLLAALATGVVGWLILQGQQAGLYDTALAVSLMGVANIVVFAVLIWRSAETLELNESALRASEERYRELFENANDIIYTLDLAGNLTSLNKAGEYITGYRREELLNKPIGQMVVPEYLETMIQMFEGKVSGKKLTTYELEIIAKDKRRVKLEISSRLIYKEGNRVGMQGIARDISERYRAEESLRQLANQVQEQANTLDAILSASVDHIYIVDSAGRYKYVSAGGAQVLGLAAIDVIGKTWQDLGLASDIMQPFDHQREKVISTGQPIKNETNYATTSGVRHYEYIMAPLYKDKSIESVVVISRDTTDRKQALQALQESEERFRVMADTAPVMLRMSGLDKLYYYFNKNWLDFSGRTIEQEMGNGWAEGVHPEDLQRCLDIYVGSFDARQKFQMEYRLRRFDGEYRWILDTGIPRFTPDGSFLGYIGSCIDISDRKQAEVALQETNQTLQALIVREQAARESAEAANRMKDEFLATLSHELRTPLNPIQGWIQLLRTRKFDDSATARALETIDRNTKLLTQLIEDVLDVSRIITGKLRLNVSPIEIVPAISAAIDTLQPAADAKEIRIESILDSSSGKVLGDTNRLQQVIWNLLANAVKFTPKGGRVEVQLSADSQYVQIRVSDTGKGIPEEFLPYVFERFRQADASITRAYGGLGLGLAIVRHLVELHGGTVHAQSPGVGQGATFTVQLPLLSVRE